ncbi:hypothetical protein BO94DRAFT_391422 [Aspergillus sclerotioniger CBS 115572]|uniref:Uncharacterized protein n=1 Tax=Aspergillus sclerotioniger CBS 115572 TaxID=1450535 RepID=A0A317WZF3_9EURO|nr:hypothetical protein BO94DRAFT_391422 [Aspergillus sclerotioniger CBS 115572]PWY91405.1 hypothetical protein BO94DRAFT_391422 [Aspergillus sclerotioniger CBS 115572]
MEGVGRISGDCYSGSTWGPLATAFSIRGGWFSNVSNGCAIKSVSDDRSRPMGLSMGTVRDGVWVAWEYMQSGYLGTLHPRGLMTEVLVIHKIQCSTFAPKRFLLLNNSSFDGPDFCLLRPPWLRYIGEGSPTRHAKAGVILSRDTLRPVSCIVSLVKELMLLDALDVFWSQERRIF